MLLTCLNVLSTCLLLVMIVFLYKFKASIPELLQGALNDVGGQLSEIFEKPQVQRAMSVLGSKSGDVRASNALKNKVAEKAMGQNVLLKKALEFLDITPLEGMQLLNDPTFGPMIQNMIANFQKQGLGRFNSPDGGSGGPGNVPNMS